MLLSNMLKTKEDKPLKFGIKLIRLEHGLDSNKIDYCIKEGKTIVFWTNKDVKFLDKYNYKKSLSPSGLSFRYDVREVR